MRTIFVRCYVARLAAHGATEAKRNCFGLSLGLGRGWIKQAPPLISFPFAESSSSYKARGRQELAWLQGGTRREEGALAAGCREEQDEREVALVAWLQGGTRREGWSSMQAPTAEASYRGKMWASFFERKRCGQAEYSGFWVWAGLWITRQAVIISTIG